MARVRELVCFSQRYELEKLDKMGGHLASRLFMYSLFDPRRPQYAITVPGRGQSPGCEVAECGGARVRRTRRKRRCGAKQRARLQRQPDRTTQDQEQWQAMSARRQQKPRRRTIDKHTVVPSNDPRSASSPVRPTDGQTNGSDGVG